MIKPLFGLFGAGHLVRISPLGGSPPFGVLKRG